MSDLVVEPESLVSTARSIEQSASRIGELTLGPGGGNGYATESFSSLANAFRGATHDMSRIASNTDKQIATALSNTSDAVSSFASLVMNCRNITVEADGDSAKRIEDAVGYPVRAGALTDHPVPAPILEDVRAKASR